jgi:hypothetical protein
MSRVDEVVEKLRLILSDRSEESVVEGGSYLLREVVRPEYRPRGKVRLTVKSSSDYILQFVTKGLLRDGLYAEAARILWGDELFTVKPKSVQQIWSMIPRSCQMMIMGCGASGKSYSIAVWLLLDWLRDPEHTCGKVISSTETHAKRNVFAHIQNLHRQSIVKLPGECKEKSIQVGLDDKQGIHLTTIPQGDEGKGRLRGFHPVPRITEHPQFGKLSRIRVILDEAEVIPQGVWEELANILSTKDGIENIKAICATNPKDRGSRFGQLSEPEDGWLSINIEDSVEWKSRFGWNVLRLDGARCENVVEKRVVYPGLLTWEGYEGYLKEGDTSPIYYTLARGWYPEHGLAMAVIPQDFVEKSIGTFVFAGAATYVMSIDLAFGSGDGSGKGGDKAIATVGRWGLVTGWVDRKGVAHKFEERRYGIQMETQFELDKTHTLDMSEQIMNVCRSFHIDGQWVVCDRTGNGTGVHDTLRVKMSKPGMPEVMGIHWGWEATDKKILDDDSLTAEEQYIGIVTEMHYAMRKFMEFDYVKFSPTFQMNKIAVELTGRKAKQVGKKLRVESKDEYKARGNPSPDYSDSAIMMIHLVRMRSEFTALMLASGQADVVEEVKHGLVDELKFIDMTE